MTIRRSFFRHDAQQNEEKLKTDIYKNRGTFK